jgi:hypothetical protein
MAITIVVISTNVKQNKTHKMDYKSKLTAIKVLLGLTVKAASEKLVDGVTVVEADEFASGFDIFVVAEDGSKTAAPDGEHTTESGLKVKTEGGKIVSVEPASEEPKVEVEVEAAETPAESETPVKDAVAEKIAEAMKKVAMAMEPLVKDIAEIKAKVAKMEEQYNKFSKAPAAGKISTFSEEPRTHVNEVDARIARLQELTNSLKK